MSHCPHRPYRLPHIITDAEQAVYILILTWLNKPL